MNSFGSRYEKGGRYPALQYLTDVHLLFIEPVVSVMTAEIVGHE